MLRRPDVTLYSLTAHAHTIVQLCGQIHPPQISNSDIRLKEIINDTLSDEFLRSQSQTGQQLSGEEVQQSTRNNYRYLNVEIDQCA